MKYNYLVFSLVLAQCFLLSAGSDNDCVPIPPDPCDDRDRAIWEQPSCPCPSGEPISYARPIVDAIVKVRPYGYAKWEAYWDTRQTVGAREEHAMLFPRPRRNDIFGVDINAHGKWQMTAIESRVGLALTGPEWNGITTDGIIEADFRGPTDATNATLRLRHAFGRISWDSGSFLFGQWWHPLFILRCFPHTVSFAIGAPMEAQARDPQLRLTQRWNWFELILALASQREFANNGPVGLASEYIRNSATPNLHLQTRGYFYDDDLMIGAAVDYKRIVPRIVSDKCVAVDEVLGAVVFEAFAAIRYAPWSLRLKGFWAENANDQLLISGFGVKTINKETDKRTYSNTAAAGGWLDFSYIFGCDDKELGLFVGGTKNLGSRDTLFIDEKTGLPIIFALTRFGPEIDYVVKVAPRFVLKRDPIRFGAELDFTRASFGCPDKCGRVKNGCPVNNVRILFALYYMF